MPIFSLITPTQDREIELIMKYQQLVSQTCRSWEWRILDHSLKSSPYFDTLADKRVVYTHTTEPLSIGEKRNWLKQAARGEWIVHCDDDDYFAPSYLSSLLEKIDNQVALKARSWFAHDRINHQLYYIDALEESQTYYYHDPLCALVVREVKREEFYDEKLKKKRVEGYGFSLAYHSAQTKNIFFPDVDIGEDMGFYQALEEKGIEVNSYEDRKGVLVKGLHESNLSKHYPQYRLPSFTLEHLLPHYNAYLKGDLTWRG